MDDLTIIYNGFLDLALFITSLCPAVEVCEKLTNSSTCNATGIQMQEFLTDHFTSKQAVFWYIQSFYNDTLGIQRVANQIDDTLDNLEWFRSVSFFFQTLLALLCVWILLGLIVKMPFQRAQKRAFFLTFCIFVIISFAFCMAFIFGAITAADLCVDSPDDKLVAVLEHNLNRVSPIVAGLGRYYISHCEDTPHEIADLINDLAENSRQMQSMAVQLPRWGFEDECIKPLVDKSMWLFDKLCKTAGLLKEIRVLAQCSKWYPLYEVFVYQTVCGSVDGSSWFAASQLVVVFMAMVILTFRVASFDYE